MSASPIPAIKTAIPCDGYIARFLTVKHGKALCPFHVEKTPSLSVHPTHYFCFGCNASGDVITFASQYHQIPIREAIRQLAAEAGVPLVGQPKPHHYTAIKQQRLHDEAKEWHSRVRRSLVDAMNRASDSGLPNDYHQITSLRTYLEAMTTPQRLDAYTTQRTPEQAALLRVKPPVTVESLITRLLQWMR